MNHGGDEAPAGGPPEQQGGDGAGAALGPGMGLVQKLNPFMNDSGPGAGTGAGPAGIARALNPFMGDGGDTSASEQGGGAGAATGGGGAAGLAKALNPFMSSLQRAIVLGSRDFVADQNTDDRDELIYRATRYAADETSTLPTPVARQISAAFVGAVEELIAQRPRKRQASAPVTHYEDFDDQLMY